MRSFFYYVLLYVEQHNKNNMLISKTCLALFIGAATTKRSFFKQRKFNETILKSSIPVFISSNGIKSFNSKTKEKKKATDILGPPTTLASLKIGESLEIVLDYNSSLKKTEKRITIERLSHEPGPDIFLIKNTLSQDVRSSIKRFAAKKGMKVAGTKKSAQNSIRTNSRIAWLDKNVEEEEEKGLVNILISMENFVADNFIHETLLKSQKDEVDEEERYYCFESLQVAKYDQGGKFDLHHDDYGRFVTVLYYLNGVGGTYFPYAHTGARNNNGLLIVGSEDPNHYLSQFDEKFSFNNKKGERQSKLKDIPLSTLPSPDASNNIVYVKPGDAIVFYNYRAGGEKIQSSLHGSLPVPDEKWITTNWIRSEKLTSSVGHLYVDQIIQES